MHPGQLCAFFSGTAQFMFRTFGDMLRVPKSGGHPAPRDRGRSAPTGPNGALRGSDSAKVGDPHTTGPEAGGAALRAAPPASGSEGG
eukprot:15088330-Alexandrium_andersonii.AAC.1